MKFRRKNDFLFCVILWYFRSTCVNICRQTDILSPGQLLHICTAAGILQKQLEKGKAESFQLDVKPLKKVQQSGEQQRGLGDECHHDEVSSVSRTSSFICGLDSAAFVLSSGVYVSKGSMLWNTQTLFNFSCQKRYTIVIVVWVILNCIVWLNHQRDSTLNVIRMTQSSCLKYFKTNHLALNAQWLWRKLNILLCICVQSNNRPAAAELSVPLVSKLRLSQLSQLHPISIFASSH